MSHPSAPPAPPRPYPARVHVGLALVALALFVFASPGRLDTIDALPRAEVASSLLVTGRPEIRDEGLLEHPYVAHNGSWYYADYSAPPSVAGATTIALGRLLAGASPALDRLYFLFATAVLAAGGIVLLLDTLRRLGTDVRPAVATCLVASGGTLLLPYGGSGFDQAQHAAVAVGVIWSTLRALQGSGTGAWVLPGLLTGLGLAYREVHGIWIVGPALAALLALRGRDRLGAWAAMTVGLIPGFALVFGWNLWRTGGLLPLGDDDGLPMFGIPLVGLAGLTISPGKGILWYSPPILLGLSGLVGLARRSRPLAAAVGGVAGAHTLIYSCFTFFGGDWCWGPRYMLVPAIVLMTAAPWTVLGPVMRRAVIVLGVLVQLLALGRDYAVYIYEERLPANFQFLHPEVQFTGSALLHRPGEIVEMFQEGLPAEVQGFRAGAPPTDVTNANRYAGPPEIGSDWMREFAVFWLPVPWWTWMPVLPPDGRPYSPTGALGGVGALLLGGLLLLRRDLERGGAEEAPP